MTRYEQGFMNKCAEYGVDGRDVVYALEKQSRLNVKPILSRLNVKPFISRGIESLKGIGRSGKDLWAKAHKEVDPNDLNWFTRLFTKTKEFPVLSTRTVFPGGSSAGVLGSSGYGPTTSTISRMDSVTKLSPERILAALATAGLVGGVGADLASSDGSSTVADSAGSADPSVGTASIGGMSPRTKAILSALGLVTAGAGLHAALGSRKKNKKKRISDDS